MFRDILRNKIFFKCRFDRHTAVSANDAKHHYHYFDHYHLYYYYYYYYYSEYYHYYSQQSIMRKSCSRQDLSFGNTFILQDLLPVGGNQQNLLYIFRSCVGTAKAGSLALCNCSCCCSTSVCWLSSHYSKSARRFRIEFMCPNCRNRELSRPPSKSWCTPTVAAEPFRY